MPWIELPTVRPLVLLHVTVVVAFSVQLVALLEAKFSDMRVFHVVPPSGEIWKVQPLLVNRSALRTQNSTLPAVGALALMTAVVSAMVSA